MHTTFNSAAFIKSQLFTSQDRTTAHLHSADVCHDTAPGSDRDDAWEEAVAVIVADGWKPANLETDTVDGGCTQHFVPA